MRNLIVGGFILLVGVGFYLASDTLGSIFSITSTVSAVATPEPEKKPVVKAPAPTAVRDVNGLAAKFRGKLVIQENGSANSYDSKRLAGAEYIAYYYSASWCPPCRAFTPDLVTFYNSFKPSHPNFELVFVSADRDESAMLGYMSGDNMPWPAVRYDSIQDSDLKARKYAGSGIPDLVLVDASGNVLSDSFVWGGYRGPRAVLEDIRTMVK